MAPPAFPRKLRRALVYTLCVRKNGGVEHIDGGAHLVAARDRAVAAVVHAFGRGRLDDDACARLLDEVQAAADTETLDQVLRQLGLGPVAGTRPMTDQDLVGEGADGPAPTARGGAAPGPAVRRLDAVDLALAARAGERSDGRRADPRMVALVVMVVVLLVLAVLGVVLVSAVRTDVPGAGSPGAAPAPVAGAPAPPS